MSNEDITNKGHAIYTEDSIYERTENYATNIVFKIIEELENSPKGKYDIVQAFFMLLSQLIYAHKYIFILSDNDLQKAIMDGTCPDE